MEIGLANMQSTLFDDFVNFIVTLLTPFGIGDRVIATMIALIPFLAVVYVVYLVVIRSIHLSFRRLGVPIQARTGVVFVVRLFFFAIALVTVMTATSQPGGGAALALTTLIGTAIGLAFSRALSNLVSGLYVFASRPFRVGDYVRIGDTEGLVLEITLNYTRILLPDHTRRFVPNSRVVDEGVVNYRVRVDDYCAEKGIACFQTGQEHDDRHWDDALDKLRFLAKGDEVYRHVFDIDTGRDDNAEALAKAFDEVCDKWQSVFLERPEFFMTHWASGIVYRFAYIVRNPRSILSEGMQFRFEVAQAVLRARAL
ncbi:MAG: mechanosensitive ion channel [Candidatus Thorarchaeota archaeon]|nr:mechanosensitive ion channel [Candidatus Thorarchaeota archaeon]